MRYLLRKSPKNGLRVGIAIALIGAWGCGEDDARSPLGPGGGVGSGGASTAGAGGASTAGAGGSAVNADSGGNGAGSGVSMRPQLTPTEAAAHTVLKYLQRAGAIGALQTDDWDPTGGIADVGTFSPRFTVAVSGGTHTTVQAAVDAAVSAGGTDRVFIAVGAGTYREMVCIPSAAPPITLYGTSSDASATVIVSDHYSGKPKTNGQSANPCNPNLTGATYGTSGSATFAAYGKEFEAKNLTFSNDTDESAVGATSGVQAVALMTQGDKLVFDNVRVLGNQDTLYVKSPGPGVVARAYFKDCYVEGDVDFVFGRGTAVLDGCEIRYLTNRVAAGSGNVVAPSTDARNERGILVIHSRLTAGPSPVGTAYLGRAWDEGAGDLAGYATALATGIYPNGQLVIRDSVLDAHIRPRDPWRAAATTDRPYSSAAGIYPANRLYEYNNSGPGSAP